MASTADAAAKAAKETSGVMGAIGNASKVFGAFNAAVGAIGSVQTLIAMFSGAKSDTQLILEAIDALTKAVDKGFKDLKATIVDQNQQQQWQGYARDLQGWSVRINVRAAELKTVDAKAMQVTVGGSRRVTIAAWCEGSNGKTGVLDDLADVLQQLAAWVDAGSIGSPSPLELWEDLCKARSASDAAAIKGETLYSQLFAWYQSLFLLVQSATYVRNLALALYRASPEHKPEFTNLDDVLGTLGDTETAGSTWAAIGAKLNSYRDAALFSDRTICATASYDDPNGNVEYPISHRRSAIMPYLGSLLALPLEVPANSYISGLRLNFLPIGDLPLWHLQATVRTYDRDGKATTIDVYNPEVIVKPRMLAANETYAMVDANIAAGVGYVPEPPLPADRNASSVVVGAQISNIAGAVVLALKYGTLRFDENGRASVSVAPDATFIKPATLNGMFWLAKDATLVDLGWSRTASALPLTNASFLQIGNRLSLITRSAWTGYRAAAFQPASLMRYSPRA